MVKKCQQCGGSDVRAATLDDVRVLDGQRFAAQIKGQKCGACGERYYPGGAGPSPAEAQAAAALARGGIRGPEGFKFLRRAVGLKSSELAALLNLRVETLSRWENGRAAIDRAAAAALCALAADKIAGRSDMRDRLEAMRAPPPKARGGRRVGRAAHVHL